ncbi:ParB/RepB/Spo0J family partition protein [Bifidobacterium pullorum subsp. gallinarum]|uniref:ParB/RepB/Spo0J family partition protein n=1 Tax=Bifidobacterium pullorum subsp. gallinarum TaxID=78344 RepID=A0A4P6DSD4_9BIFI|nr:ParB/RepB/Spo0J family partition protein [Bifidobacterium pullorum]QAY32057.1 ParB/RepB/Spo0J family partition protein [Bifidobacterium pullorum subsp. gallinarum]
MSTRSRLGKGLGALFPALPGEALPSEAPTSETPLPETAPHDEAKQPAAQAGAKPSGATRSGRKTSGKRASMPSLDTIVHPSDMFFDTTLTQTAAPAPKAKEPEPKVSRETSEAEPEVELQPVQGGYLDELRLDAIVPNAHQPRTIFDEDDLRELSDSIREVGVLQPIVVRRLSPSQYELVMGERRWRASKLAGLETIPAIVKTTSDNDMLRDALLENLHRVALNPLEEAAAYQQMIDEFGLTQQQLSKSISKSRPQIANTLRLLNLPVTVQKKVASGVLSAGHARALLALPTEEAMEKLADRIIGEGLSVRSTEEIVSMQVAASEQPKKRRTHAANPWVGSAIQQSLENRFDTKVSIKGTAKHGRIEIVFSSPEDMDRIMKLLVPESPARQDDDQAGWV